MFRQLEIAKTVHLAAKLTLIGLLTVIVAFYLTNVSRAHPPKQEPDTNPHSGALVFEASAYIADDDTSAIYSQETGLDSAYFTAHGTLDGLTVTLTGLTLAQGHSSGAYVSGVINTPLAFTTDIVPLWSADLPDGTQLRLETRLSFDGDTWSEWLANPVAFYPVRDELHSGNLIWIGSDRVTLQFRVTLGSELPDVSPTLNSLILVFNDTSDGPTDAEIAAQMTRAGWSADVCPAKPHVISRTGWGCPDGQNSPRRPPVYRPVTHIIIHQAETPNHTRPYQNWAGWVRSVWNYHANVLWWGDVGYNYLIDPAGNIYEGRAGGDDVVGIHDTHNLGSMAIGFLGCYGNCDDPRLTVAEPSPAMLDSAANLMAWKLGQKGIDPLSTGPYGGMNNIPVIAGGRDVTWTSSPGDNLYAKLPWLRQEAKRKIDECSAKMCEIEGDYDDPRAHFINDPIHLWARVKVDGQHRSDATVTAHINRPDSSVEDLPLPWQDDAYKGGYTNTNLVGGYHISMKATGYGFKPCHITLPPIHLEPPLPLPTCQITANIVDPRPEQVNDPIHIEALVEVNGNVVDHATVTAHIKRPDASIESPGLPWQQNVYQGSYPNTDLPGRYEISATAADGPDFKGCSTPSPAEVVDIPAGPTISVQPSRLEIPVCSVGDETDIVLSQVANVQIFSFKLKFDPNVVEVADQDLNRDGVQIRLSNDILKHPHTVMSNEVDQSAGFVELAVRLLGAATLEGDVTLGTVSWLPKAEGETELTLQDVTLLASGGTDLIPVTTKNGTIQIKPGCGVSGHCFLQGRDDHSGVMITAGRGHQVQTNADGSFFITGSEIIIARFPGYLSAQVDLQTRLGSVEANGSQPVSLEDITLLGGDVNGDDAINIFDLAYIATHYRSADSAADLNADGVVNILDLALAASNFGQNGPPTNWQLNYPTATR